MPQINSSQGKFLHCEHGETLKEKHFLPREVFDAPCLTVLESRLDNALSIML